MRIASLIILWCAMLHSTYAQLNNSSLTGAWESKMGNNTVVMICTDKLFAAAVYQTSDHAFIGTCGGTFEITDGRFVEVHEFNTMKPEFIGRKMETPVELKDGTLVFTEEAGAQVWNRIDNGKPGVLAGAWLITKRKQGNEMVAIKPGARRTMKILSGTKFQWIAYNVETKEFFGTGGGTYTAIGGKYVEQIEFFSRDNSRVGASLTFDFELSDGEWRHSGLSSKGDPIDEVWTKREKIEL